ncbi:MAG TPA: 50S ribosomal protein L15 [Candidatus Gastranaerophilales bacterium]|nr:50S ribosomal protein L15 [Candidatus Gastranaerophilales bacterium]
METTENKTIKIDDLRPAEGAVRKRKRVGRGISSGMGKTSTRGHRGEGQRSGQSKKRGFEGGQMPAYRKVPKLKGFPLVNRIVYAEINVSLLEKLEADVIDLDILKEKGLFSKNYEELRVLGNGEITKKITVKARHFSKSAKEKIEAAGGQALQV